MNVLAQTEASLKQAITQAVIQANLAEATELPDIILEVPKDKSHGDFATNIAMQLARIAKKAPREIAEEIKEHINVKEATIEKIEIAGPGFINFFMKRDFLHTIIQTIIQAGVSYGETDDGVGQRAQVEFVSVNPTGSLHLG
ncbi:MAG TPA: arginine--tRNA ligase, partial [Bacillota bacterium]|nr:arginine--tRNA ligase [Bacillota bacterium]